MKNNAETMIKAYRKKFNESNATDLQIKEAANVAAMHDESVLRLAVVMKTLMINQKEEKKQ